MRRRIPRATYRLQLTPSFTFAEAATLVPHLARLGISHLYLSPILEAVPGSTHGYDVIDPTRIRREFGGEEGLADLAAAAQAQGLGLIADIVPNHVGLVSPANPWWWDTLRHGPEGRFGRHLDIRWQPGVHGQPTVLVAELGATLREELEGDDLHLEHRTPDRAPGRDGYRIVYHDHAWPVRPDSLHDVGLDERDVATSLARIDADRGLLRAVLDRQHYRLAYWRRANEELNHRRFFDVTTLGAVRIEDPDVFADVHAAVLPRLADGALDGLRIDHPDGLRDPVGYFHRLRETIGPEPWLVVEKILEHGEPRRRDWPVDGTVGYAIADLILGLHVDAAAGPVLDGLQAELTGAPIDRPAMVEAAKREALDALFGAERAWLTDELLTAVPDLDRGEAHDALVELLVAWPVYRTYVRPEQGRVSDLDRELITDATATASRRRPDLAAMIATIERLLLLIERPAGADAFVRTFQQLTGPAIAKGLEDTVLYRDLRFVAVNEVGGHPGELGRDPGAFHADSELRQRDWPHTMVLSSTHDNKRSHDVRARLAVLSQRPERWADTVRRWRELAGAHRRTGPGRTGIAPAPEHEHLAFQTVVGAWPITSGRLTDYLVKAAREGKEHTDWLDPDEAYEEALGAYATALLEDPPLRAVAEEAVAAVREPGWLTALSMQLLALTTPGVPDIYQGNELWDLSLVDPDNRRPVDHATRAACLAELPDTPDGTTTSRLLERLDDGLPKLWLIRQALRLRQERPSAFGADASYLPVTANGERAGHVAAYVRDDEVAVVAPLRVWQLGDGFADWTWGQTTLVLPSGRWHDVLSGAEHTADGPLPLTDLLRGFPVALLTRGRA